MKIIDKYFVYTLVTQEMGTDGFGGYGDYAICKGDTPEEAIRDWCKQMNYDPKDYSSYRLTQTGFVTSNYFSTYFIKLPEREYIPTPIIISKMLR